MRKRKTNFMIESFEGLEKILSYISWSAVFALIYATLSPGCKTFLSYLTAFLVSIPMGTLAGMIASQYALTGGVVYAIVSVTALLSQDLVKFVLSAIGFLQDNRLTIFKAGLDWLTGKFGKVKNEESNKE